jgi:hypothetical protein
MTGRIDTGGFVYPIVHRDGDGNEHAELGITRRDWLAGLAMQGIIAGTHADKESMHPTTALEIARGAYHLADLLIRLSREQEEAAEKSQAA